MLSEPVLGALNASQLGREGSDPGMGPHLRKSFRSLAVVSNIPKAVIAR